ncbi:MAG: alpha-L-fucosidase [Chloroflexota bacterium]|nr:alpha-L-fucosidase [Chloroflexota bacterium]
MKYEPTYESLQQHAVPDWFHNAKLGIFVHWGLFSVPAWAPLTGELEKVVEQAGWETWFAHNPYAEWYANSLQIPGSPTQRFHTEAYGGNFTYDDFVPLFNEAARQWNPEEWAALFKRVGARYVVPVTKHHDGFLLWPSERTSPAKKNYRSERDIVGELADAVRKHGLRLGLYYSGGLDWTFNDAPIRNLQSLFDGIPQSPEYVAYANAHWRELIDRYEPSIMWNDIGYPAGTNVGELFAYYYNTLPDGVINDRFRQGPPERGGSAVEANEPAKDQHYDFRTPEYATYDEIMPYKWESTRGLGFSFGYNRNEGVEHHLAPDTLIRMLVDIVSKNGNLLINVGPAADGSIPELQRKPLEALGAWLAVNGEAIFDTRPWTLAEGRTTGGTAVRYTQKGDALYAILLDTPRGNVVTMEGLQAAPQTTVQLLGYDGTLDWRQEGAGLTIALPAELGQAPAHALRLIPQPSSVAG